MGRAPHNDSVRDHNDSVRDPVSPVVPASDSPASFLGLTPSPVPAIGREP